MASRRPKPLPEERRRAEARLNEFAEYVEQRQYASSLSSASSVMSVASTSTVTTSRAESTVASTAPSVEGDAPDNHAELDALFDGLDLTGAEPQVPLKRLLLGNGTRWADPEKPWDSWADSELDKLQDLVALRILEGSGEAVLDIGFEHNNDSMGLNRDDYHTAQARLFEAARRAGADCDVLLTRNVGGDVEVADSKLGDDSTATTSKDTHCSAKVLVRKIPESEGAVIETRIAVVGNVDAGKSSMVGVLVKGDLDDGRDKARVNLFRHKHEIESGRTSSVGLEVLGFDSKGKIVRSDVPGRKLGWEDIARRAAKCVTFSDLAGHERYLRTTVFGLLSSSPNYCLLMIAANNGLVGMTREHLGIALAVHVPVMVVITKIDACPAHVLADTIQKLTRLLKSPGARKVPIFIRSRDDAVTTATQFGPRLCPIFQVSNVTGENLDLVRLFLNIIPHHGSYDADAAFEMRVNDVFSVPFSGTVVSGVIKAGVVHEGDPILIGPDPLGRFTPTIIRSIERKKLRVPAASAGQSAAFALRKIKRKDVRKGMVLLPPPGDGMPERRAEFEFVAEVMILSHSTTIKPNYQAMLHVGPVQQTCAIVAMDRQLIRTGDRGVVVFRFMIRPEYVVIGDRILFRDGRTKGLGTVTALGYSGPRPLMDGAEGASVDEARADI